uniref:Uncharacterized protein n=1 Tax=Acrobeloides nanus TaxID=290746 RepID=A0A914E1C8_9BILA
MDQESKNISNESDIQPVFRKIKKKPKPTRSLKTEDNHSTEEDEDVNTRIEDIRELQKVRERKHGLNALECAMGKDLAREFDDINDDPFRMKGGGMLRLSDDKKAALNAAEVRVILLASEACMSFVLAGAVAQKRRKKLPQI